jgi:hypothetical protein
MRTYRMSIGERGAGRGLTGAVWIVRSRIHNSFRRHGLVDDSIYVGDFDATRSMRIRRLEPAGRRRRQIRTTFPGTRGL